MYIHVTTATYVHVGTQLQSASLNHVHMQYFLQQKFLTVKFLALVRIIEDYPLYFDFDVYLVVFEAACVALAQVMKGILTLTDGISGSV